MEAMHIQTVKSVRLQKTEKKFQATDLRNAIRLLELITLILKLYESFPAGIEVWNLIACLLEFQRNENRENISCILRIETVEFLIILMVSEFRGKEEDIWNTSREQKFHLIDSEIDRFKNVMDCAIKLILAPNHGCQELLSTAVKNIELLKLISDMHSSCHCCDKMCCCACWKLSDTEVVIDVKMLFFSSVFSSEFLAVLKKEGQRADVESDVGYFGTLCNYILDCGGSQAVRSRLLPSPAFCLSPFGVDTILSGELPATAAAV
ncbi:hypothetical protein ZIOFF_009761 [Zingiber officinale]|uniref:Uncharacterized protein n=1 Tax=Zingiber officinale TaxID=94328 RepID=A0A8J5HHS4_ZINOF|nr:hypothetical protein ZIOFF_009761 [Zingiber officinale]